MQQDLTRFRSSRTTRLAPLPPPGLRVQGLPGWRILEQLARREAAARAVTRVFELKQGLMDLQRLSGRSLRDPAYKLAQLALTNLLATFDASTR